MYCAPTKYWPERRLGLYVSAVSIESKSVVIIGGSSGIGLSIARQAVDAGAEVIIAGRSEAKLEKAREAIAGDVTTRTVDMSDEQSVKKLFSTVGSFDHHLMTSPRSLWN